jgi:hypothetical protein
VQKRDEKNLGSYFALIEKLDLESERSFIQSLITELIQTTKVS